MWGRAASRREGAAGEGAAAGGAAGEDTTAGGVNSAGAGAAYLHAPTAASKEAPTARSSALLRRVTQGGGSSTVSPQSGSLAAFTMAAWQRGQRGKWRRIFARSAGGHCPAAMAFNVRRRKHPRFMPALQALTDAQLQRRRVASSRVIQTLG